MLESSGQENAVDCTKTVEFGAQEPLLVALPRELQLFFRESGYLATTAEEERGNARLRVRSDAKINFRENPTALQSLVGDHPRQSTVLIKDLSRSGIGILFHRQLFPHQRFTVTFQGREIDAVVVRCRRVSNLCYEIGATVLETTSIATR